MNKFWQKDGSEDAERKVINLMTLATLLRQLSDVYGQAACLLERAGFDWDNEEFLKLEWNENDADAYVPVRTSKRLAVTLCEEREDLMSAMSSPDRHIYRLHRLPGGRFGYKKKDGRMEEMYCGRGIEALVDVNGHSYWVACSIEYRAGDYYVTCYDAPMEGLLVREPRGKEVG